jgi:hypothetical protein
LTRRTSQKKRCHYHIYVILLNDRIKRSVKVRRLNPEYARTKPCVYVGMTGLKPHERFQKHLAGYKSSRYVKNYGVRLMPELFADLGPFTYDEAVIAEEGLARRLRAEGYMVVGGH